MAEKGWYYSINSCFKEERPEDRVMVMLAVQPVEGQQAQHMAQDTAPKCPDASSAEKDL